MPHSAAHHLGRAGYRITLASTGRQAWSAPRAACNWSTSRCRASGSTRSCSPAAAASSSARRDAALIGWIRDDRRRCPAGGHGVQRHVPRRPGRAARRPHGDHALGPRRQPGRRVPGDHRRRRPDLPARRQRVDLGRGDRRHRSRPGAGRGRPRRRRRPERGPLAGDVPPPPGRPDAVRRPGVDPPSRPPGRPRRPVGDRRRPWRRPPRPGARRRGGDEPPPLHPSVHRGGRRVARPVRRAGPRRGRPPPAGDHHRHARRDRRHVRLRNGRDPPSSLPPPPRRRPRRLPPTIQESPSHDQADRHRRVPTAHRPRRHRTVRGAPAPAGATRSSSSAPSAARCAPRTGCSASPPTRRSTRCPIPTSSSSPAASAPGR